MSLNLNIHPKYCTNLIAHKNVLQELVKLYNNHKLHHAYIFSGIKSIGKATFAYYLTKLILSNINGVINNTNLTNFFSDEIKLITNNTHPNLLAIEAEYDTTLAQTKANITIDQVRQIKSFLTSSSLSSKHLPKVIIIDAIDDLNVNSSNSILKLLEEPLPNRLFFLICHNITNILPTIKSRCIIKHFSPLTKEELIQIILSLNIEDNYKNTLINTTNEISLLEGSLYEILWLLNEEHKEALDLAKQIINTKDIKQITLLSEKIKNFSSYNFKHLIESIFNIIPNKKSSSTNIITKTLTLKLLLEQEKVFNIDKHSILTSIFLDLI